MTSKGGLGGAQLSDLREGFAKKRGWCFEGGRGANIPMHTMMVMTGVVKS